MFSLRSGVPTLWRFLLELVVAAAVPLLILMGLVSLVIPEPAEVVLWHDTAVVEADLHRFFLSHDASYADVTVERAVSQRMSVASKVSLSDRSPDGTCQRV
jgi:hypothetical protein